MSGHSGFLAEAQLPARTGRGIGNYLFGGFASDFATGDGEQVMVVAADGRHFADLAAATGLAETFGELGRLLGADFAADADRYAHREVIASLLAPWFARRSVAEIGQALDGTSVLWSRYRRFADLVATACWPAIRCFSEIDQPGVGADLSRRPRRSTRKAALARRPRRASVPTPLMCWPACWGCRPGGSRAR